MTMTKSGLSARALGHRSVLENTAPKIARILLERRRALARIARRELQRGVS